ncbi:esterase/lipase family protein [Marinicella rhabdoformis]|uniref:esterase/lipase family protein n=1 Tax=Marinicella rhabdoformis TaxID=2580566 RepID=UPI0012AEB78E|nr:hypothetical protein [Marinicella rhabdoformis]
MSNTNKQEQTVADDLKGLSQLAEDGTVGVMALVESMHLNVLTLGGMLRNKDKSSGRILGRTTGLTGLIYRTINKTTSLSFKSVNLALAKFKPLQRQSWPKQWRGKPRNQWLSALNGVLGDHLEATDNPLQINMQLMHQGKAVNTTEAAVLINEHTGESLFLVHGLCMNDEQWLREGHDHGEVLANSHKQLCFYLRYNTGRSVQDNGKDLSDIMGQITEALPEPKVINFLCHSMGGLVCRSAIHQASQTSGRHDAEMVSAQWLENINKVIFLGTPHQGATLEKAGNVLDYLLTISSYSAPFAKLTRSRSQGIQDLQHGCIHHSASLNEMPKHIMVHAVAGTRSKVDSMPYVSGEKNVIDMSLKGDGLVSVSSAVAEKLMLKDKGHQQRLLADCNHMELLGEKASQLLNQIFN